MADGELAGVTASDAQVLLAGLDAVFEQVLYARYGGGVVLCVANTQGETVVQSLREPAQASSDLIRLVLQPQDSPHAPQVGRGFVVGTAKFADGGQSGDINVMTEIFDDHDCNEQADATSLHAGLLLAPAGDGTSAGGLSVIRSSEAGAIGARADRRQTRGWLPQQIRLTPGRTLGLSSNGHRRAPGSSITHAVSASLLRGIGAVLANWSAGRPAAAIGGAALVVETSSALGG